MRMQMKLVFTARDAIAVGRLVEREQQVLVTVSALRKFEEKLA